MEPAFDAIVYGACVTFAACAIARDPRVISHVRGRAGPSLLLVLSVGVLAAKSDVWASDAGLSLAAMCGAIAIGALLVSTYKEHVVVRRLMRRLRNPESREPTLAAMRAQVEAAAARGDVIAFQEALRGALEPLIVLGEWSEVVWYASFAESRPNHREGFARWLRGVHALAEMHTGDLDAAAKALEGVTLDGPWLKTVDALRLALSGEGEAALARIDALPARLGRAARHQKNLAEVHALAGMGRRGDARKKLETMRKDGSIESVLDPQGPASGMAASMIAGAEGPFRASA